MGVFQQFFCVVANGLEAAVAMELESLDLPAYPAIGGVYTKALDVDVYKLTKLRTPTSIRWQLINGRAVRSLSDFRTLLDSIDWSVFPRNCAVQLSVSTRKSKINRSDILEEKAGRLLQAVLGKPKKEASMLPVVIRLFENKLWVSVTMHGRPLHQRGWRNQNVKTPIRENWAQCLLWLSGCTASTAILDPFCGSGTILIEAGRRFSNQSIFETPPWLFANWSVSWSEAKFDRALSCPVLLGADRDAPSVDKTRSNAHHSSIPLTAVVSDIRDLTRHSFETCPEAGVIVCNPPYGMGSGNRTDAVYHWLGETHRKHFADWSLYFIATDFRKASLVSSNVKSVAQFSNAGIPVTFYQAQ